jgi:hypothetical protein
MPMLAFAPRLPPKLLDALVRLDDPRRPIAETCRRVGAEAERIGARRPSYERVRELIHQARRLKRRGPSTTRVLVDVMFRARPPEALLDQVSGIGVPPLRAPPRT